MTRLLLIRHAEVESRYQKVFGGRIDMDLSPNGRTQAEALAKSLQHRRLDAIYSSPMKRVQQTLAPLMNNGAPKPITFDDLREVDFGDWTGYGWDEVQQKFGMSAFEWLTCLETGAIPNAESMPVYRARIEPCIREIIQKHPGQTVAVYCHGGVIRMILCILLEVPFPKTSEYDIEYASVTEVVLADGRARIERLNFTPWRDHKP